MGRLMETTAVPSDFRVKCRVVICGSRGWRDRMAIYNVLSELDPTSVVIVTGGRLRKSPDVDRVAAEMAESMGFVVETYEADWDRLGRSAGFMRNDFMVHLPDVRQVIAFWDGKSPGTFDTLRRAQKLKIPTTIYRAK